ncbi:MAG: VWA domain-containing protein [Planctomycetes bacterium]|nr:VWA domain-containing protein [Planctomycetota bacterium]MCB9886559.1 VWA domain-containing protein [Planctomycetota bacterium]
MTRIASFVSLALAGTLAAQGPMSPLPLPAQAPVRPVTVPTGSRQIDLVLCLDISGSMNGLIDAARQNLWSVVNEMATLQPEPQLRVALLTYGCSAHDKEVGWVKTEVEFTHDLDMISEKLFALTTNGGEEYVARVVKAATEQLDWSKDPDALKLLFVAGNEAATQDPQFTSEAACRAAIAQGIVVNSIYCGDPQDKLAPAWRDVARFADGQFAAIDQNKAVVIATPFDEQLQGLSASLNTTYVPYGAGAAANFANQARQDGNASSLNVAAAAQRCQTKASGLYWNAGWDLVDACKDPKFVLSSVNKETLPEALRALDEPALRAHIESQQKKRSAITAQVEALGKQRDAFVQRKQKEMAGAGLFENAVLDAVRQQAEARGFRRAAPVVEQSAPPQEPVDPKMAAVIATAAAGYAQFPRVTGEFHVAPTDCRMPPPRARVSEATKAHGGKLYLLFARMAKEGQYVTPGVPAPVGETLVKEAWQAVPGHATQQTPAGERYGMTPEARDGAAVFHAGEPQGLFVMHKLAADTPGTDQGWVYGTIDATGVVTAAGRIASCMRCHQDTTEDRRFGLR